MKVADINEQALVDDYKSGASLRDLANKYGASRPTIKKRLLKNGIGILSSTDYIAKYNKKHRDKSNKKNRQGIVKNQVEYVDINRTTGEFVEQAASIHNSRYDYSLVDYKTADDKVIIICPIHNKFRQTPHSHLKGHGCPNCGREAGISKRSIKFNEFLNRAVEKHGNKFRYIEDSYNGLNCDITIICQEHGEYNQNARQHLYGRQCPRCAGGGYISTTNEFISKAVEVHGGKFDYSRVEYSNNKTPVTIVCPVHGEFMQKPNGHLNGHGCLMCARDATSSAAEFEIVEFLNSIGINSIQHSRSIIPPLELDIFVPDFNVAIEYNGIYWHSFGNLEEEDKYSHCCKLDRCKKLGVRLIQIFENEWIYKKDIVKSMLVYFFNKSNNKIYARNCDIKEISTSQYKKFTDANHMQGYRAAAARYGLFDGDELVAIGSFNKYGSRDYWEVIRFANKLNHHVVGGFSKILKHFIRNDKPSKIVTYADRRYSDGSLYNKCGFKYISTTDPNYYYVNGLEVNSRQKFQKHKLKDKLREFDKNLTEAENMFNNGYRRLWDAGNLKYQFLI